MSNRSTPTLAIKGKAGESKIARLSRRIVKLQTQNAKLREKLSKYEAWERAADAQVPR